MSTNSSSAAPAPDEPIPLPAAMRAQMRIEFEARMKGDMRPVTVLTRAGIVTLTASQVAGNDAGRPQCLRPDCANNGDQSYLNARSRDSHISHIHSGYWWQSKDGKRGDDDYHVL